MLLTAPNEFDQKTLKAFKKAAIDAYQQAAKKHGVTARYLNAKLYTMRKVHDWQDIEVE